MGTSGTKSRRDARLRRSILAAALQVLAEQGYARVSMRKIAALIDYSPTTIYRFFRNKEDLLQTIAAETYGDLSERFRAVRERAGSDPLDVLRALVREYVVFCVERPDMYRLYSELASFELEDGAMYERLGGRRFRVYESWNRYIHEAVAAGRSSVSDETRLLLYLWDSVKGYIEHRISQPGVPRGPLQRDAADFIALVFAGVETTPTGQRSTEA